MIFILLSVISSETGDWKVPGSSPSRGTVR